MNVDVRTQELAAYRNGNRRPITLAHEAAVASLALAKIIAEEWLVDRADRREAAR